ncbi:MAG TPA: pyridoxamine 5'-phosphate oxidase family protein [Candidatus Limnocylindrales bacterium]|nr:pyridoxamine 5'-phosphate oxidase family protein [Candidatus Limnocylindrales bacterium]
MNASVPATWHAPDRPGYDPTAERTVARVLPMLGDERVVWLSTVRPDGTPHLVPTWFLWDGTAITVFSKPDAVKARNLRANPRLMVAVGDPEDDFSVGLIEAEATRIEGDAVVPEAFFAKYAAEMGPGRLDRETFRTLYTESIRIVPTRFLAWHGRGAPASAAPAPAAVAGASAAGLAARIAAGLDRVRARLRGVAAGSVAATA